MKKTSLKSAVVAAAVTFSATLPSIASATKIGQFIAQSPAACVLINPDLPNQGWLRGDQRGLYNQGTSKLLLACPVPHGSDVYADQISVIQAEGWDGRNNLVGTVDFTGYVHYWDGAGGRSSAVSRSGGSYTGPYGLHIDGFFVATDRDDFVSVTVALPSNAGSASNLSGIYFDY